MDKKTCSQGYFVKPKKMTSKHNNKSLITRAKNLIQNNQAMTLSTAMKDQAWAAPVFYVNSGDSFYFFPVPMPGILQKPLHPARPRARYMKKGRTGRIFWAFR